MSAKCEEKGWITMFMLTSTAAYLRAYLTLVMAAAPTNLSRVFTHLCIHPPQPLATTKYLLSSP